VAANAAVCAIVALLALAAACERVSSRASASRLWDAQARERAPDTHAAFIASDSEFAFAFSRQKPVKLRGELSLWERVRQHVFAHTTRSAGGGDAWHDLYGKDKAFADAMGFRHDHGDAAVHGEDIGDVRTDAGELTRCVQAAYAATTYFCGADRARLSVYHGLHFEGVAALSQLLARARAPHAELGGEAAQLVLYVSMDDEANPRFGHAFALHVLPDGRVSWMQSNIASYSLRTHLARTPPLDNAGVAALLANLRALEGSARTRRPYGAREAKAFRGIMHSPPLFAPTEQGFLGNVTVSAFAACVVPPFSSELARAPETPAHAAVERSLVLSVVLRIAEATRRARGAGLSEAAALIAASAAEAEEAAEAEAEAHGAEVDAGRERRRNDGDEDNEEGEEDL